MSKWQSLARRVSRGKIRIELAPNEVVLRHEEEISVLLDVLGHPEALVTDETTLSSFPLDEGKMRKIRRLGGASFGTHVTLAHVAERMREARNRRKRSGGKR
jgi:hypothetical protein